MRDANVNVKGETRTRDASGWLAALCWLALIVLVSSADASRLRLAAPADRVLRPARSNGYSESIDQELQRPQPAGDRLDQDDPPARYIVRETCAIL